MRSTGGGATHKRAAGRQRIRMAYQPGGSAELFYHKNHQGTVTDLTNSNGGAVKSYWYDAYGNVLLETGSTLTRGFTYTGRERHARSGLYYYRARFYDPILGRFLSEDPIGLLGGVNLYAYVGNDPVNWIDPLGLDLLNNLANLFAGMGSVLSFGLTDVVNDLTGASSMVDECSGWHSTGEWTGVGLSVAIGGAGGLEKGLAKAANAEWSHWIPIRLRSVPDFIKNSRLNGQYMNIFEHALNDPYRYRFMPNAWKAANPINPGLLRQLNRMPPWVKGSIAGATYGVFSMTKNGR